MTVLMVRQINVSRISEKFWHIWQLDGDVADDEYDRLLNNEEITDEMLLDLCDIERRLQSASMCFPIMYYNKLTL